MSRIRFAILTFAFLLTSLGETIHAQEPDGVIRTFLVIEFSDVDFSDEDSVLLKVGNDSGDLVERTLVTGPDHPLAAFDGETFGFGVPVMYLTKGFGDTPVGTFGWLLDENTPEAPPVGSVALLGADAVIIQSETFYVTVGKDFLYPSIDPTDSAATIVTAVFTK